MVLSVKLRTFDSLLAPRSQTASSGSQRCSISTWRSACTDPGRVPGGWQQCWGAWQRQPLRRRQCATPDSFAAATLPRCCDERVHCQQPSSQLHISDSGPVSFPGFGQGVGGGTPLGLGGFLPPLDDSKGAWTNFEPSRPSPHTTPHRIRACLSEALAP